MEIAKIAILSTLGLLLLFSWARFYPNLNRVRANVVVKIPLLNVLVQSFPKQLGAFYLY